MNYTGSRYDFTCITETWWNNITIVWYNLLKKREGRIERKEVVVYIKSIHTYSEWNGNSVENNWVIINKSMKNNSNWNNLSEKKREKNSSLLKDSKISPCFFKWIQVSFIWYLWKKSSIDTMPKMEGNTCYFYLHREKEEDLGNTN